MESRNLILAIILSVGVLFIWSFFFEAPEQEMLDGEIESNDVSEVNSNELDMEAIQMDCGRIQKHFWQPDKPKVAHNL